MLLQGITACNFALTTLKANQRVQASKQSLVSVMMLMKKVQTNFPSDMEVQILTKDILNACTNVSDMDVTYIPNEIKEDICSAIGKIKSLLCALFIQHWKVHPVDIKDDNDVSKYKDIIETYVKSGGIL